MPVNSSHTLLNRPYAALGIGGSIPVIWIVLLVAALTLWPHAVVKSQEAFINNVKISSVIEELIAAHGESERSRAQRSVKQAARLWRQEDGTPDQFAQFCTDNYISDPELLKQTADRLEAALESIYGHLREMGRELSWHLDVDTGPILPVDYILPRFSLGVHVNQDMFKTKLAFLILLNFPVHTLEERLRLGPTWTRDEWAQARLAEGFSVRVPPEVSQKITDSYITADTYISEYNIYMHHLLDPDGNRLFPENLRLVTHWNLRDELKSQYGAPDGLPKQEMIFDVMQRIIRQQIPAAVINNPAVDWKLSTNEVTLSPNVDGEIPADWKQSGPAGEPVDNSREPDTRYQHLLAMFHAQRGADPYYPDTPTLMDRRFKRHREILESEVEQIFKSVLASPVVPKIGRLIEERLGRKLRPYDIWYDGFKARASIDVDLDSIVTEKYPRVEAFQADLPNLLKKLGFDTETASFLASKIQVDPSRGIGHASGAGRRVDKAHLRTRVAKSGMDYKGYNIAIHEFGHNVEQVFSYNRIDHTLLRGVPNTAFTEGFAFVFQARDLELLGLPDNDPDAQHLRVLDDLWGIYEIAGVSMVDMGVWNWMYAHPEATPAELREAVISIAKGIWNEYYAPVFGVEDEDILAIYSHMIDAALYLPDYPLGGIIQFQIEEHLKAKGLGEEMERMCKIGSVTPDLWMNLAVGEPISTAPMIQAAEEALIALTD